MRRFRSPLPSVFPSVAESGLCERDFQLPVPDSLSMEDHHSLHSLHGPIHRHLRHLHPCAFLGRQHRYFADVDNLSKKAIQLDLVELFGKVGNKHDISRLAGIPSKASESVRPLPVSLIRACEAHVFESLAFISRLHASDDFVLREHDLNLVVAHPQPVRVEEREGRICRLCELHHCDVRPVVKDLHLLDRAVDREQVEHLLRSDGLSRQLVHHQNRGVLFVGSVHPCVYDFLRELRRSVARQVHALSCQSGRGADNLLTLTLRKHNLSLKVLVESHHLLRRKTCQLHDVQRAKGVGYHNRLATCRSSPQHRGRCRGGRATAPPPRDSIGHSLRGALGSS
mmetsp:Transcript_406/g.928  ORF Transcript_406/g.928 Transcript_406/m.928 type:complete len:340 (-) Transcript_406:388-1407(-)